MRFIENSGLYKLFLEDPDITKEELDQTVEEELNERNFLCYGDKPFQYVDGLYDLFKNAEVKLGNPFPNVYEVFRVTKMVCDLEKHAKLSVCEYPFFTPRELKQDYTSYGLNNIVDLFNFFQIDIVDHLFDLLVVNFIPSLKIMNDVTDDSQFLCFNFEGFHKALNKFFFNIHEHKEILNNDKNFFDKYYSSLAHLCVKLPKDLVMDMSFCDDQMIETNLVNVFNLVNVRIDNELLSTHRKNHFAPWFGIGEIDLSNIETLEIIGYDIDPHIDKLKKYYDLPNKEVISNLEFRRRYQDTEHYSIIQDLLPFLKDNRHKMSIEFDYDYPYNDSFFKDKEGLELLSKCMSLCNRSSLKKGWKSYQERSKYLTVEDVLFIIHWCKSLKYLRFTIKLSNGVIKDIMYKLHSQLKNKFKYVHIFSCLPFNFVKKSGYFNHSNFLHSIIEEEAIFFIEASNDESLKNYDCINCFIKDPACHDLKKFNDGETFKEHENIYDDFRDVLEIVFNTNKTDCGIDSDCESEDTEENKNIKAYLEDPND